MAKANEFSYEVTEKIAIISQNGANTLELRKISYNGAEPKLDLRRWWTDDKGIEKMGKGLTLSKSELDSLGAVILQDFLDNEKQESEEEEVKVTQFKPKAKTSAPKKSTTTRKSTTAKPKSSNTDVINLPFK